MSDTQIPTKEHELDVLIVKNIDLNCEKTDTEYNYNHRDYFQVNWSNHPHRIVPGGIKKMPRFLAEHYAKHLADHVLMEKEIKENKKGLVQSAVERPKTLKEIIIGVDTWYLGDTDNKGDEVVNQVEALNPEEKAMDLGTVVNPMVGILKDEPKTITGMEAQTVVVTPPPGTTSVWDDTKPKPAREQLLADCEKLGIEVKGDEDVETLIQKIKAF